MSNLFNVKNSMEVKSCLERGDDINSRSAGRDTPFIFHCKRNHVDVVISLIEYGCNISYVDIKGIDGFLWACIRWHTELVKEMLKYEIIRNTLNIPYRSNNPLITVCKKGYTDIFDTLILNGANPNLPNDIGNTPLIIACHYKNVDIVDRLLLLNININFQNEQGKSAIFYCNSLSILDRLFIYHPDLNIQDINGETVLNNFILYNFDNDVIEGIINYNADVDIPDIFGSTPLINAVKNNNIYIVNRLLKSKADPYFLDNSNNSALDYAITNQYADIILLLQNYMK